MSELLELKPVGVSPVFKGPWKMGRQGGKRASVIISISLSVASLVISACASLRQSDLDTLRALNITGIVINTVSVSLSALTSLDWKTEPENTADMQRRLQTLITAQQDANGRLMHVLRLGPEDGEEPVKQE